MENADKIVGALRCCGNTDTKKPDCEHCPLQSTRMCVKVMLEGAADLIVRLNDFDQTQSKIALERCQKAEAQLAISQRETQAAMEDLEDAEITIESACTLLTPRPDGTISAESARQILFDYGEPHEAGKGKSNG